MKLFISIPMKGRTREDVKYQMTKDKQRLEQLFGVEFELIDSVIDEDAPKDTTHPALWFIGKSISMMADADLVYFSKGWEGATGCKIEQEIAKTYDVKRLYYNNVEKNIDFNKTQWKGICELEDRIKTLESLKNTYAGQKGFTFVFAIDEDIDRLRNQTFQMFKEMARRLD